jgi:hypothetical protein
MKLLPKPARPGHLAPGPAGNRPASRQERGSALIVVIALLALMLMYLTVNIRTLSSLTRELRLVERQQTNRLARASFRTNAAPQAPLPSPAARRASEPAPSPGAQPTSPP